MEEPKETGVGENRREFLRNSIVGGMGAASLAGQERRRILIQSSGQSFRLRLAERELLRGLNRLRLPSEVRLAGAEVQPAGSDLVLVLRVEAGQFRNPQAYSISGHRGQVIFSAAGEQALLYAVFDFLERQGAFFGTDGESYPIEPARDLVLPEPEQPWNASPRFAVRGLLPWPNFLNGITTSNEEDFRAYFEAMLRMRFNTFGMHVYSSTPWCEAYLPLEFAGVEQAASFDAHDSGRNRNVLSQRTSRFTMGASQFYDSEVFGSDATRLARDPFELAERTRHLLREAFRYAGRLGIRTGIGFEPYSIPDEILRALPPEVTPAQPEGQRVPGPRIDIESVTAHRLLEARLGQLLDAYPDVEYVWLWEQEGPTWYSRETEIPLSATPFLQAHDFLRRHAPAKRLVLSGWGATTRHFETLHKALPADVIFSCLNDSHGGDPVHEVFGKLEGRERWPIEWLEDDGANWQPQLQVYRFEKDLNRAAGLGCQGVLGLHWRHRIVDPVAGFQARFSWDEKLSPDHYYRSYARSQATGDRATRLAAVLADADRNHKLLSTFRGDFQNGHAVLERFSGNSDAFVFWKNYMPRQFVVESQKQVAAALSRMVADAPSALERERIEYLRRQVAFLVPYAEAWTLAHRLHVVLQQAGELKKAGRPAEARDKVRTDGVPIWLRLAPEVRRAMLEFQRSIATRNDLGTLLDMHNKFVRLTLVRLRLSIQEYLGDLPTETETLLAEVTRPDVDAPPRLFVPTRPSLLAKGERVRVMAVATGQEPIRGLSLLTRTRGAKDWAAAPASLLGRRTYQAFLGPYEPGAGLAEYYFSADVGQQKLVAPPDAPRNTYALTVL